MKKKNFKWRAFVSMYIAISFLIMTVTGIVLYFAPAGRVAFWSAWKFMGLTKDEWQAVHTIFTFLFVIGGGFHLFYNWKPFMSYLRERMKSGLKLRGEFVSAFSLTIIIFVLTLYQVPPFSTVMDFGETLSESWETEETAPPEPHAELKTIEEFAQLINLPTDEFVKRLSNAGFVVDSMTQTIKEVAEKYEKAPNEIYNVVSAEVKTVSSTEHPLEGSGYGRKTLSEVAKDLGVDVEVIISKIKQKNLEAKPEDKLKDVSTKLDMLPYDLLEYLKVKKS